MTSVLSLKGSLRMCVQECQSSISVFLTGLPSSHFLYLSDPHTTPCLLPSFVFKSCLLCFSLSQKKSPVSFPLIFSNLVYRPLHCLICGPLSQIPFLPVSSPCILPLHCLSSTQSVPRPLSLYSPLSVRRHRKYHIKFLYLYKKR